MAALWLTVLAGCIQLPFEFKKDEPAAEAEPATPPPPPAPQPPPVDPRNLPAAPSDIQPGSADAVKLYGDYVIEPPAKFNVFELSEGDDFQTRWVHYRWERLAGGAWFTVSFFSGLEYESERRPDIRQPATVEDRLRSVFARIDADHQLYSRGIVMEKIGDLEAVRTNVAGRLDGDEAIGHLFLIDDGTYVIEIAAVANERNREVLRECRQAARSFGKPKPGAAR